MRGAPGLVLGKHSWFGQFDAVESETAVFGNKNFFQIGSAFHRLSKPNSATSWLAAISCARFCDDASASTTLFFPPDGAG
jgi:hypothetical protein